MQGWKIMASPEDDSDLETLRLAVLASLKAPKRPQNNSQENDRPPRSEANLENLRTAALCSKRGQDGQFHTSRKLPMRGFSNRGYRREFGHPYNSNSRVNANLIVIQPVPLEQSSQQPSSTSTILTRPQDRYCSLDDDASQSPKQQKTKSTGKFSRFESDSSGNDSSSESDYSESEEAKSPESSEGSEKKGEEDSFNEENTNDDESQESNDVLLLHAEEQLQEGDQLLNDNDGVESLINKQTEDTCDTKTHENVNVSERNDGLKTEELSSNNRTKVGGEFAETNCVSEKLKSHVSRNNAGGQESNRSKSDKDRRSRRGSRDRLKLRGQRTVKDRSTLRDGEKKEAPNSPHTARVRNSENDDERRKRRDRHAQEGKSSKNRMNVREKHRRKREENKKTTESVLDSRKIRSASNEGEQKVHRVKILREGQQDGRARSRESSLISKPRSPSPSSKSQPVLPSDLRQKLKSRSGKNDTTNNGGGTKRQEHSHRESGQSSGDEQSVGRVKSVLSVVKLSSRNPKVKSAQTVRPEVESKPAPISNVDKPSRKTHSPVPCNGDRSPRMRKVLLLKEGKSFSDDDHSGSKRTRFNITLTEVSLKNEEISYKQRVPVRLRLGNLPKSSKSTSKPETVQIAQHHHSDRGYRSSSPSFVFKSGKKRASIDDADDPPRKVKLKRDAFLSTATLSSSSKINGFPSKKSHNESGKTYENELDEKIRRIRVNNEAILKRKSEIEEDEQVNF